MFFLKAAFCLVFQTAFLFALPILPYREPEITHSCSWLSKVFKTESIKSVLVITDKEIINNGLISSLEEVLKDSGAAYALYDNTQANHTVNNIEESLSFYRKNNCDALIAIGGGSSTDCAKACGARIAYPQKTVGQMKGNLRVLRRLPTLIAIPTTVGTGSEVTLEAIITDSEKQNKYALMRFSLIPHYAVLDAKLTYSLSPHLTYTTGTDAFTNAVKSYIGRSPNKETPSVSLLAFSMHIKTLCKK